MKFIEDWKKKRQIAKIYVAEIQKAAEESIKQKDMYNKLLTTDNFYEVIRDLALNTIQTPGLKVKITLAGGQTIDIEYQVPGQDIQREFDKPYF